MDDKGESGLHPHSKKKGLLWIAAAVLLAFALAGGIPFLVSQISLAYEAKAANFFGPLPMSPCQANQSGDAALATLMNRLFPIFPFDQSFKVEIQILSSEQINAFAFLGGKIYVFQGLLEKAQTPEELAGVIAHEIGHIEHRHVIKRLAGDIFLAILESSFGISGMGAELFQKSLQLKYSRTQEEEADRSAFARLDRAKISSLGMVDFFERLEKMGSGPEIFSDHPSLLARAAAARAHLSKQTLPVLTQTEWKNLQKYCR